MNDVLIFILGIALGTKFAEPIRDAVPLLGNDMKGEVNDKTSV